MGSDPIEVMRTLEFMRRLYSASNPEFQPLVAEHLVRVFSQKSLQPAIDEILRLREQVVAVEESHATP